jgi:hypothetical protein
MIDNFILASSILKFENKEDFYNIILIKRKKDLTTDKANHQSARVINSYNIYNKEYMFEKRQEIIDLCELLQCRAYIQFKRKNDRVVAFDLLENLSKRLRNEQYDIQHIYSSIANSASSKDKILIVDIDTKDEEILNNIKEKILDKYNGMPNYNPQILLTLPTNQGFNLITTPFRMDYFMNWKTENKIECDIHNHGTGLLYFPQSLTK